MNVLVISMLIISVAILGAAFYVWFKIGGRPVIINGLIGSLAMLYSAQLVAEDRRMDRAFGLPVLIGMLLLGRAIGTFVRSKKEPQYRLPSLLWFAVSIATLSCSVAIYLQMKRSGS